MRNLITTMNTVPSVSYTKIKAVVDREGSTENGACSIQWVAPNWYRVGIWNDLDARWEYTATVTWADAVQCLRGYGLL